MKRLAWSLLLIGLATALTALALKTLRPGQRGEVMLAAGDAIDLGMGTLVMKGFEVPKYPGGRPRQFVTSFHIIDRRDNAVIHGSASVNHPFRWHELWIHQTSYDSVSESFTVLTLSIDPYLPVAVAGGILLLLGSVLLVFASGSGKGIDLDDRTPSALRRSLPLLAAFAAVSVPLFIIGRAVFRADPVPALQSPLMAPHVAAYAASYIILLFAAFGILKRWMPAGFFLMTAGLVIGAVWGKLCWGDWWQYDPKEMWGLATWTVYLVYFAVRGHRLPERIFRISGAVLIIFTATLVNFSRLFSGLHNYVR